MGRDRWRKHAQGPADRELNSPFGYTGGPPQDGRAPIGWGIILLALLVWTALAYFGSLAADAILSWLASSSGAVLDAGKSAGGVLGKEVGVAIDSLKSTGVVDQAVSLLRTILKPAAIAIWALGALAIILLARNFSSVAGALRRGYH